jgi:hypothetical protein
VVGSVFAIAHKISRLLISSKVALGKADQKKGGLKTDFTEVEAG